MRKLLALLLLLSLLPLAHAQIPPEVARTLRTFETPHYIFHTDLADADAREADLRMTRMFEEYQRRTAGFTGTVNGKFPFYLFKTPAEYYASGAPKDSGGVFMRDQYGSRLMAIAGEHTNDRTWHVVQHEGFHQFTNAVIRGELPIWVNEGLAEYFGEAVFTGDSFVSGLIPPDRLEEVKEAITKKQFKSFAVMLAMSHQEWNAHLDELNYTQAWAMVHFLANADNGKYQAPFVQFMNQVGRGTDGLQAWNSVFGTDTRAFQAKFEKWWLALPEQPTRTGYVKATVMIITSYMSRAFLQGQRFKDMDDFMANFHAENLKTNRDIWLPPKLFNEVSPIVQKLGTWTLAIPPKQQLPRITFVDNDGTKYVGQFTVAGGKVLQVWADVTPPPQ